MAHLRVGYEALDWATGELRGSAATIEEELRGLASRMPTEEAWGGAAASAFLGARTEWEAAMRDMRAVLEDIAATVQLSREEYAAAEAANARRFQG